MNVLEHTLKRISEFGDLLFLARTGSHLYGTNTENSDEDFVGVFIAKPEYYIGFKTVNEVDCSIVNKDESGKNTKDAIDIKVYELKTFLKLCADSNPNIVELLFVNKKNTLFNTDEFKVFQKNYHWFINQRVRHSFLGYAKQQMKKGIQKGQNFSELKHLLSILEEFDENSILAEHKNKLKDFRMDNKNLYTKNLTFQLNLFVKKVKKQIQEKIQMVSHRAELWEKYGYDTKFFMHLFRLLDEGENLLKNGKLEFPLKNKEYLLDIRKGKFSLKELNEIAEERISEFDKIETNLPKKSNWNAIENELIKLVTKKICKG